MKHLKHTIVRHRRQALAMAMTMALLPAPAMAQEVEPARKKQDPAQPATLGTVTVTASRREEDAQKVPVSITTVASEKLDVITSGGDDVRALASRLPSLNIESSYGRTFPRFYVRGLGNSDFDLNSSQPVSLIYDEIVQENPILKGFPIFDLDRVELLRGPQGTLFGRNTPAGVVKFESRRPTQENEGYGQISYGSYGTVNLQGAVGGGLSETVSGRISGLYQHRDDYVDNIRNGSGDDLEGFDESAIRGQLLIEPGNGFSALLNGHARHLDGTARTFRANIIKPGSNDLANGFDRDVVSHDGQNYQKVDTHGASARLSWEFDRINFHSITGYESAEIFSRADVDGGSGPYFGPVVPGVSIGIPSETADGLPEHGQFTQEFRWESRDWGRTDWQAGLYYFNESLTIDSFSWSVFSGLQDGYAYQKQDNTAWAAFASIDHDVSDDFKLRGGLRYTSDSKDFELQRQQSPLGFLGQQNMAAPAFYSVDANDVSWDLSGLWEASEQVNVFGRVARGFRAPSFQGRALFAFDDGVSLADSETILSFEAGIKANFNNNRTRVGFSLFSYSVNDQQLTAVGGGNNTARLLNVDKVTGRGFELDLESYLTDELLVTWGTSYNRTEIKEAGLSIPVCGGGFGATPHCTVLDPTFRDGTGTLQAYIDGNSLPNAPKWIHNFTARYGVPMGQGEFFVYTDWAYRSEVNLTVLYDSAEYRGAPLLEGGVRVGYNWGLGRYELALFGRNITDETALIGAIDFSNLTGMVNEPRTFGLEFKGSF